MRISTMAAMMPTAKGTTSPPMESESLGCWKVTGGGAVAGSNSGEEKKKQQD